MDPIICENDLETILGKIQELLNTNSIIRGIRLVDQTDTQVVILLSDEPIDQRCADAWWSGFNAFLGQS